MQRQLGGHIELQFNQASSKAVDGRTEERRYPSSWAFTALTHSHQIKQWKYLKTHAIPTYGHSSLNYL